MKEKKVEKVAKQAEKLLVKLQKLETGETVLSGSQEEMVHLYRLLVFLHGSSLAVAELLPGVSEAEAFISRK